MNNSDLSLLLAIEGIKKRLRGYRAIRRHLPVILIIGLKRGCMASVIVKLLGITYSNWGNVVVGCIDAGVVRKAAGRYYLTDKGQDIYNSFHKELSAAITIYRRSLLAKLG